MDKLLDALLEIGAEEIPSSYLPPALEYMKSQAESKLAEARLPFKVVRVLGTPRRLALLVTGLAQKSEIKIQEVLGPKLTAAKDAEGHWTAAAQGFARSQGAAITTLETRQMPKGEVVCVVKKTEGVKVEKIIQDLFSDILVSIPFPKKMMWEASQFRFARPIRNLVALLGSKVLKVTIAGVKSGNKTFSLSHTSSKSILISSPQAYLGSLKNNCILADPQARKELISHSTQTLAHKVKGSVKVDESLLEEVTWLTEHPVGILGNFSEDFLDLPSEILITCMKKHQKFFSLEDPHGKLLPHFIGIRNGISEHQETVRSGYEKVLLARLYDAKFFYDEDLKKSLDLFSSKSAGIFVQDKLGSVGDRIVRMKRLGGMIADSLSPSPDRTDLERAAHLCKFDLSTRVVFEYPELQGLMGEIYALRFKEKPPVAQAIREHYEPVNNQSPVPASVEGKILALSEKLDQLCGHFWLGNSPSGNADPYGLRRVSNGILRILLESGWDLSLTNLIHQTLDSFSSKGLQGDELKNLSTEVSKFLTERFQLLLQDANYELDEIYSVTHNLGDPDLKDLKIPNLRDKVEALHTVRKHPDFEAVAGAYKRASNILKQARQKGFVISQEQFDFTLLQDPAEKNLHSIVNELTQKTQPLLAQRQYQAALQNMVGVRSELDQFFDKVMVMDPDEKVSKNRLSLLFILQSRFRQMADFSLIQNRVDLSQVKGRKI